MAPDPIVAPAVPVAFGPFVLDARQARLLRDGAVLPLNGRPLQVLALLAAHVGYGVQPAHYDLVGGALLDTLAAALGDGFTPAHRAAWAAMYGHVSQTMLAASRPVVVTG